eukprot:4859140-Amphidinium_carterae.1
MLVGVTFTRSTTLAESEQQLHESVQESVCHRAVSPRVLKPLFNHVWAGVTKRQSALIPDCLSSELTLIQLLQVGLELDKQRLQSLHNVIGVVL